MNFLTSRINRISPSITLKMTAKAAELRRLGKPVFNMSVGEPDFPTPENIQQAGIFAIQNGHTKYTPGSGIRELKEAVCQKIDRDNHLSYSPDNVVVSCGGKHALYNACQVLFDDLFHNVHVSYVYIIPIVDILPKVNINLDFRQNREDKMLKKSQNM